MYDLPSSSQKGDVSYPVKLKLTALVHDDGSNGSWDLKMT